jgi:malate dehydrogenase (oxaloacetate-decarboxylating)(NADP+)
VVLDVGTDNDQLRTDPLYPGIPEKRLRGPEYDALVEEFVGAVQDAFPDALLQWEDFATENAQTLLARYRERLCTFNDDIQGTAAVSVAALLGATRITGEALTAQRILFFGAGASALGVASLIVAAMVRTGWDEAEARSRVWLFDSKGLVTSGRSDLSAAKRAWAHDHANIADLATAVDAIRPTALFGLSTRGGAFDQRVLRAMASHNQRPIIFALSNPTSKSECTAEDAYRHTGGRAVFASGSPFPAVHINGGEFEPRQANNAYIFPGLGLGAVLAHARSVSDDMFLAAADALAAHVSDADLARGAVLPPLDGIRTVSAAVAAAVIREAMRAGLARAEVPANVDEIVRGAMYQPVYRSYV